jgi:hypothetical protein
VPVLKCARVLCPCVRRWWVPILGPVIGAVVGSVAYSLFVGWHSEQLPPLDELERMDDRHDCAALRAEHTAVEASCDRLVLELFGRPADRRAAGRCGPIACLGCAGCAG